MTVHEIQEINRTAEFPDSLSLSILYALSNKTKNMLQKGEPIINRMVTEVAIDTRPKTVPPRTKKITPPSTPESRARLMSCYLSLFATLGGDSIDPFLSNWLIEWILTDLSNTEEAMRMGEYPRRAWLWAAILVSCAVASVRPNSATEARQVEEWRAMCYEKIRLGSLTLNLKSWGQTKNVLASFLWRDEYDEEQRIKEMWEETVFGKSIAITKTPSPSSIVRRDFMSLKERRDSVMRVQLVYMNI